MVTGTQASPATDYTGLYEGLKVIFEEPIGEMLVQDTEAYDLFQHDLNVPIKETGGGRYIELAHYAADGGGFGARREGGAIPEATAPSIFNGRVTLRKNQMTVEMSGETMRRVKQGEAAWLTWAKEALPNAVRRMRHHLDRETLGYGQGVLGKVTAVTAVGGGAYVAGAAAVITVGAAFGVTAWTGAVFQFMRNDLIRFAADINGVTLRDVVRSKITSVDLKNSKITVDVGPAGLIVGDFIAIGDNAGNNFTGGAANAPVEMMGLLGIVDDGSVLATFQNQTRAAVAEYQCIVTDAAVESANKFTEDLLLKADDDSFTMGGGTPDVILGHRDQERQYYRQAKIGLAVPSRVGLLDSTGKNRGFHINLNGRSVDFRVARKMPNSIALLLQKDSLKKWQVGSGFSFDDTTGSIFERAVTGNARYDAFYAVGNLEGEVGCTAPNHNTKVIGINPAL